MERFHGVSALRSLWMTPLLRFLSLLWYNLSIICWVNNYQNWSAVLFAALLIRGNVGNKLLFYYLLLLFTFISTAIHINAIHIIVF